MAMETTTTTTTRDRQRAREGSRAGRRSIPVQYTRQEVPERPLEPGPFEEHGWYAFVMEHRAVWQAFGLLGIGLALLGCVRAVFRNWSWLKRFGSECRAGRTPFVFREKLMDMKLKQLKALLLTCCYLLIPVTAWASEGVQVVPERTLIIGVTQNVLAVLALFPSLLTPKSFDAVFCGVALLLIVAASPFAASQLFLLPTLVLANGLMMLLVAVRRTMLTRLPVLLAVGSLFAASCCSSIVVYGDFAFGEARVSVAWAQAIVVLLITLTAPLLERHSRAWMYQITQLEELQELLSASQCLLRSCFDVVVELDAEGCITSPGPELGSLLLRESSRQCMQGDGFAELLEDEDARVCFRKRLNSPGTKGLAENMQVSMRDACGNSLRLECMWFAFTRMGMESRERFYMLGLRELSEQREPPALPEGCEMVATSTENCSWQAAVSSEEFALHKSTSVPETHSVSSGASFMDAGAVLIVDGTIAGYPVKATSTSFRARVGHLQKGRPLSCCLVNPRNFRLWIVRSLAAQEPEPDIPVIFRMPQGKVHAFCRVLKARDEQETTLDSIALFFYGIQADSGNTEGPVAALSNRGTSPTSSSSSLSSDDGHKPAKRNPWASVAL